MNRLRSPLARLAVFAAAVALLSAVAALAGAAIDPDRGDTKGAGHGGTEKAAHGGAEEAGTGEEHPPRGLAIAEDGLRLVVDDTELEPGTPQRLAFRIVDEHGETVEDFDVAHEKRMHLILARRDLTGFQHLHPEQAADGAWSADATLAEPGSYRLFADFTRDDEPHTLGADLHVDGAADLRALPAPATTASADGYDVRLDREGEELRFTITRDGEPVATDPYLGAGGHLVALREGDLAFLHVHPTDEGVTFETTFPSEGRYRLFLQFKHAGRVHTVAFTEVVR